MKTHRVLLVALWFLSILSPSLSSLLAQAMAFTYQGRLTDNGAPANGVYDLEFRVFNMASGGSQQGSTLAANDLAVLNGLFTVLLDFTVTPF